MSEHGDVSNCLSLRGKSRVLEGDRGVGRLALALAGGCLGDRGGRDCSFRLELIATSAFAYSGHAGMVIGPLV